MRSVTVGYMSTYRQVGLIIYNV